MIESFLRTRVLTPIARRVVLPGYARQYRQFQSLLGRGTSIQRDLLFRWLHRCRNSRFGRDHGFGGIQSLDEYRRQVPISGYDYFAPYINGVAAGRHTDLFPEDEPVRRFTITTGTTGIPKLNPVTPTWMHWFRRSWNLWGGKMLVDHPEVVGGKILHIIGSWDMGKTAGGIPISMVSALLARDQSALVRPFYSVPNDVTDIAEPDSRYYATLRLSMADDIGLIVVMSPGTLLRLAQFGDAHRESLIRDIHDGTLSEKFAVPPAIRQQIKSRTKLRHPARARALERIIEQTGHLYPKDYWPGALIACWLGGTAGYQARFLPEYFGTSPMRDQGLVSSEGRHTIPVEDQKPEGVMSLESAYYEFVPADDLGPNPVALEGHELDIDREYQIVMTTFSGYFRFRIGDLVRCRRIIGQTPVLEFLQKSDRCGDLEGEKVTEFQFLAAASEAAVAQGIRLGTVAAVPVRSGRNLPCYQIIIEHGDVPDLEVAREFLESIDTRLRSSNFLYKARRREKVLGPPVLSRVPAGSWSRYMHSVIAKRGTGEGQYKHTALVQDPGILDHFQPIDQIELANA